MRVSQDNILFILLAFLPLSMIIGPAVSLVNIIFTGVTYLFFFFKHNHFKYLFKNVTLRVFLILYLYLILNTLISISFETSILRNFGFLRFILLFFAINYFFYIDIKKMRAFYFWTIIFLFFVFDVYFERITGANIFGWGAENIDGIPQHHGNRIVSFFKDEPIAGAFINGFIFVVIGYLLMISKNKNFPFVVTILIFILSLVAVLMTGERSNTIKVFIGFTIFLFFLDFLKLRIKLFFLLFLSGLLIVIILNSDFLKLRYKGQFYDFISSKENRDKTYENNIYIKLYKSGFEVFKNHPFLGVGNKNYRIETCKKNEKNSNYVCTTHPHQIYVEFLAEHGILGFILILYILFFLIFRILKQIIISKNRNYVQVGSFIYLLINFIPLLPSGSFFSDFNITLFMLNFSVMYAVNKKTNIFYSKN